MPGPPQADVPLYPGPHVRAWIGTLWAFCIVTTSVVALRVYVTLRVTRQGTWALIWTLLAWLCCLIATILPTLSATSGLGQHQDIVLAHGAATVDSMLVTAYWAIFVFEYAIGFGKVAVVAFLLTIQGTVTRNRYLLYFVAATNMILAIPISFIAIFQCSPPKALWSVELQAAGAVCNSTPFYNSSYWWGAWNALSDLFLAVYPIFLIFPLNISTRLKMIYTTLLGLGVFAAICSVLRTYFLWIYAHSKDQSYDASILFLFAEVEMWLVVLLASIPAIWPLLKDRILFRGSRGAGASNYYRSYPSSQGLYHMNSHDSASVPKDQFSRMYSPGRFGTKPQPEARRIDSARTGHVSPNYQSRSPNEEIGHVVDSRWDEEERGAIVMRRDVEVTHGAWAARGGESEVEQGARVSHTEFEEDLARFGLVREWETKFNERR